MSAAVRRRKISIRQQLLMSSESLAKQTSRTNRGHRHQEQWRLVTTQPVTNCPQAPVPAPSSPMEQADMTGGQQPVSSGVKRDAREAELPDVDEQGGKFLQVEGLTTVDAEGIPCELSVEDCFMIVENSEGVNEEIVKTIVAGKKRESSTRRKHSESLMCAQNCREMKRCENLPKGDKWICRFVAREFRHDDPENRRT